MEPWNDGTLLPPSTNTVLYSSKVDAQNLLHACNNVKIVLSKQSPLHKESAILSRFIYKFDMKFRNDIGYRIFKKINTALRKYLTMNLLKDIHMFMDIIPNSNDEKYYPTKQMLEYVLVRIITFSKIMMRICICSKQASIYYMNRIKRGESHWMSLMPYALLSRVWSITTVLLQHSTSWYTSLYPYLEVLQLKGVNFLPPTYELPTDLGNWLGLYNLDNCGRFQWSNKRGIQINLNIAEEEEVNFGSILDFVKDVNNKSDEDNILEESILVSSHTNLSQMSIPSSAEIKKGFDEGISVSREYFDSFFKNQSGQESKREHKHSADNVTNKISLDTFIEKEENYRIENNDSALTKHLSFMQWQTLKTSFVNLSESISNNRKIERKFKKIWKEKCLDYL